MTREPIYAAVFALAVNALTGEDGEFTTFSRRLAHIDDLQPSQFPAFYQTQDVEDWTQQRQNLPSIGNMRIEWWVYVQNSDETMALDSQLNPLVDALIASLQLPPAPAGTQTLGGLVTGVVLDGPIQFSGGALSDRAFVRIPLVIKTPN